MSFQQRKESQYVSFETQKYTFDYMIFKAVNPSQEATPICNFMDKSQTRRNKFKLSQEFFSELMNGL